METSYLIGLIAVILVAVWGITVAWRKRRDDIANKEMADDFEIGDCGLDLNPVAEIAAAIARSCRDSAHPANLLSNTGFQKGVDHLLSDNLNPSDIADGIYHDDLIVACIAIEALARRTDGMSVRERILGYLGWVQPWPVYFVLRNLDQNTPVDQPLIGRVLAEISHQLEDTRTRLYLEEFVRDRLKNGEVPQFSGWLNSVSDHQFNSLKTILDSIDSALGRQFEEEVTPLRDSGIDLDLLRSIGLVWGEEQVAATKFIIEHKALIETVDETIAAILGPQGRSLLIVGEEGVGKATTIASLACRLYDQGWTIFQAGHAELIAGQTYIGQLEERTQILLRELSRSRHVLWIIPDFQNLAFSGLHKYNPVSVLDTMLPHLKSGNMTIVGAVQPSAYEKLVTWNPAVSATLSVQRMSAMPAEAAKELAIAWLEKWTDPKGDHKKTASEVWELATQFLTNACAPGNILKLLDMTRQRLPASDTDKRPAIGVDELTLTLSQLTGLPVGLLDEKRQLDLDGLERTFNERVLGQAEAVQCLVERVAMIKAGLTDPTRPAGVFLFAGPTGTGKTEIAKTLTEWLFGSADRMIRLDMSEFQTSDDLGRIVGEPDTSDSEALVGKIRKQPFSVILLDEFEKAHPRIWDIFLQVFDDGRLTGRSGQTADFRHSIIILTSNLGAVISTGVSLGFRDSGGGFDAALVLQQVEKEFRKEFINRLDRVVVFRPLTRDLMRQILEKELNEVLKRRGLRSRPWAVEWDEEAIEFLLRKGFTPDLGARPLKRAIDRHLLSPLAITIVKHQVPAGDQFLFVTRKGNRLDVQFVDPDEPERHEDQPPQHTGSSELEGAKETTLTGIALQPHGTPTEIRLLRSEYDALLESVGADGWRESKASALSSMQDPDFWASPDRFATLDMIERRDRVESALRRAGSLLQRVAGPSGGKRDNYPVRLVSVLGQNLYLLKLAMADIENGQPCDAIIQICASGPRSGRNDGAAMYARELAQMYRAWAKKRGMKFSVLEENDDETSANYKLVAAVDGFGAHTILAREHGMHVFERQKKNTKAVDRYRVSVEVSPLDSKAQPGKGRQKAHTSGNGKAGSTLKIVRRYRKSRSPLVRDSVTGWRTGRIDLVLGGDFDLIQGSAT